MFLTEQLHRRHMSGKRNNKLKHSACFNIAYVLFRMNGKNYVSREITSNRDERRQKWYYENCTILQD